MQAGVTFAAPGVIPEAFAANANLFVSAESSTFDNHMSGPQVIEVLIIDSDINDTDRAEGEPDVEIDGSILRMTQATDGNWYAYFADRTQALRADNTAVLASDDTTTSGTGLDFGTFCLAGSGTNEFLGIDVSETVGFAVGKATGGTNGNNETFALCTEDDDGTNNLNVLREAKEVNPATGRIGNTALRSAEVWPFIQLYNLNPTGSVEIQYNKGGGAQTTTLTFDTVDEFAKLELDREVYPRGAQVHATITDTWLNIDPTDEDSWTFGTNTDEGLSTHYQVFDENGGNGGDLAGNSSRDISSVLTNLMTQKNAILILDVDSQNKGDVITIQDTSDTNLFINGTSNPPIGLTPAHLVNSTTVFGPGTQPVTITEQGPKSGIFATYDDSDTSTLRITSDATRGTSASLNYNDEGISVVVRHGTGNIDIQPPEGGWSSGTEAKVVLVDSDANTNTKIDEDFDLFNPDVSLIPSIVTGSPFTLANADKAFYYISADSVHQTLENTRDANVATNATTVTVDRFSDRAIISGPNDDIGSLLIGSIGTMGDLRNTIQDPRDDKIVFNYTADPITNVTTANTGEFRGFNLLNYDLRSLHNGNDGIGSTDIYLVWNENRTVDYIVNASGSIHANVTRTPLAIDVSTNTPGILDLGVYSNDTSRVNHELYNELFTNIPDSATIGLLYTGFTPLQINSMPNPIVTDFFSFGFIGDGTTADERVSNQIIRLELEELKKSPGTFIGTLEYAMLNQVNILDSETYTGLATIDDEPTFIVIEDLTDEDSIRVNYFDLGSDGVSTQIADQEEAPSHSGVVSFNLDTYKTADTVVITLVDKDLNADTDLKDIYTVVDATTTVTELIRGENVTTTTGDVAFDIVGSSGLPDQTRSGDRYSFGPLGRLLDVTFDDQLWARSDVAIDGQACTYGPGVDNPFRNEDGTPTVDDGLGSTTFSLVETTSTSGTFVGDFQIPSIYCHRGTSSSSAESVTGTDIEVNYVDFRDASGEIIEVGDSAGVRANTGSISLDRTVYPVPWGTLADFGGSTGSSTPGGDSVFPIHSTGIIGDVDNLVGNNAAAEETLGNGDLTIHVRISDPDFDVSASGEDTIAQDVIGTDRIAQGQGPVKITVSRGADEVVLAYAGGDEAADGRIDVGGNDPADTRKLGPITEIAPTAGVFELDFAIRYTDGPASSSCPDTTTYTALSSNANLTGFETRFVNAPNSPENTNDNYCILQGDIITVEYTDPTDAAGDPNTVTDSATFDLRNGVLQSDKNVYIIGSDIILTVIEPDWDLDNDAAETYDLDVIEWDSDAAELTMGDRGGEAAAFDPEPTDFRETGDSTGIFQIVIETPETLGGSALDRGEEIELEYIDWGPAGSDYVGQEDEDIKLTIFTSNFGATIELDQKVYSWTDKVYITIVAPDHNFDSDLIDEIGETSRDPIKVATRGNDLDQYKLVETGTDTGIFTGEVILTGFGHDADGLLTTGDDQGYDTTPRTGNVRGENTDGLGPTDGFLATDEENGITVSFEFSEDETVVGSALIRWNIGETQWLEASYPATGTGVLRVVDPDMNLNPESVDNFDVDVWSTSDAGGIDLTVTETNEATGIFEGTVYFTLIDESSGHRLRVAEGDTVTGEYEDHTLPKPYSTAQELEIKATSLIGTIVPPLERAPISNLRVIDNLSNTIDNIQSGKQVQLSVDFVNGQDKDQPFTYIIQIQDANEVVVGLNWISGALTPGQSFSPSASWTPTSPGSYTATAFVWESLANPTALSPDVKLAITVT